MSRAGVAWSLFSAFGLVTSLSTGSCSGGGNGAGGGGGGNDGGQAKDGTTTGVGCSTDAECTASLPVTTPPDCATASCNALQGVCVLSAKDTDGDGHPAANCASTVAGVTIQDGDDCNDDDPNIYPGHPESCRVLPDGGTASAPCQLGQKSCQADGTESACNGVLVCVGQACAGGQCTGVCAPGDKQCTGDSTGVQSCQSDGTWSTPVVCIDQTCAGPPSPGNAAGGDAGPDAATLRDSSADAPSAADAATDAAPSGDGGVGSVSCQGSCAPGQVRCAPGTGANGTQACGPDGVWEPAVTCPSGTCIKGLCEGPCSPNQTTCSGNGLQTCEAGTWSTPAPCTNQTCVIASPGNASCIGVCAPNQTHCTSSSQSDTCQSNGQFGGNTSACSVSQTCVSNGGTSPLGSCQGGCGPTQTQCAGAGSDQTCGSNGQWNGPTGCPAHTTCAGTSYPVPGSCGGQCGPGDNQACSYPATPYTCTGNQTCSNGEWSPASPDCSSTGGDAITPSCPGGWTGPNSPTNFPSVIQGACTIHEVIAGYAVTDSSGDPFYTLTPSAPPTIGGQVVSYSSIRVDYHNGGCNNGGSEAIVVSCNNGNVFHLNESQAGSSGATTGSTFDTKTTANGGTGGPFYATSCTFQQDEGWTGFAQGTCKRYLNFDIFYEAPPAGCH